MISKYIILILIIGMRIVPASSLPIDPMWKSESFIKAFTASYGIDSRIEPSINEEEKKILVSISEKMGNKDRKGAIALLSQTSILEKSPALLFNMASLLFEDGKASLAISQFSKAISLQPNFRDAHRNLAIAYVQEGDYEKAEPVLRKAIELGSNDGLTMGLLGYCLNQSGRSNDALQAFRMAKLTMPDELQWQVGEATIYEAVLMEDPNRIGIWVNLANIRLQQGNNVQAIADMEVAKRLKGLNPESLITLGHLYLNESLYGRALGCYRESIENPELIKVSRLTQAIEYLLRFKLWNPAKEFMNEIKEIKLFQDQISGDEKISHQIERADAIIQINIGDQNIGLNKLEELLKKDPLDGEVMMILASHYSQNKDSEKAIMLLEQASQVQNFTSQAERKLGEIYVSRGDYEKALISLKKSQDLEPQPALQDYIESIEKLSSMFERK
jgi:tetratricopeptide (TPR) repeat protein